MTFCFTASISGIAYLFLFAALFFLTYRFFQYWQKTKDISSKAFFYFALSLASFAFIRAISGLFFINNARILVLSTVPVAFFQGLAAAITIFIIFHMKVPKISPWVGFGTVFALALIITALTAVLSPYSVIVGKYGAITWISNHAPVFYYVARAGILALSFIIFMAVLIQQGMRSAEASVKIRSFGVSAVLFLGLIIASIEFLVKDIFKLMFINSDIMMIILSIVLFFVILFTQKLPSKT